MNKSKQIISILLSIVFLFGIVPTTTLVSASTLNEENEVLIPLEDGRLVTPEEFVELLENYTGPIYMDSVETQPLNVKNSAGISTLSASIPMDEMIKIVNGTFYIPGVGQVVLTIAAVYVGGVLLGKLASSVYDKVNSWLTDQYIKKIDDAIRDLGDVNSQSSRHIQAEGHCWDRLVPGSPQDSNRWGRIKAIIKRIMLNGKELAYGSAFQKQLYINGEKVIVTYQKVSGKIRISNSGWKNDWGKRIFHI